MSKFKISIVFTYAQMMPALDDNIRFTKSILPKFFHMQLIYIFNEGRFCFRIHLTFDFMIVSLVWKNFGKINLVNLMLS